MEELRGDVVAEEDHVEGDPTIISSKSPGNTAGGGVFRAFPLLDAVVLEASRYGLIDSIFTSDAECALHQGERTFDPFIFGFR